MPRRHAGRPARVAAQAPAGDGTGDGIAATLTRTTNRPSLARGSTLPQTAQPRRPRGGHPGAGRPRRAAAQAVPW
ncbi:hypothetical protein [Ornithinimicrobium kibberense]|uniref:hypothetical protein n=1 Tax=Ornithinimicrobium kibberense TaxID=282060 RepID=UPI003622DBBD